MSSSSLASACHGCARGHPAPPPPAPPTQTYTSGRTIATCASADMAPLPSRPTPPHPLHSLARRQLLRETRNSSTASLRPSTMRCCSSNGAAAQAATLRVACCFRTTPKEGPTARFTETCEGGGGITRQPWHPHHRPGHQEQPDHRPRQQSHTRTHTPLPLSCIASTQTQQRVVRQRFGQQGVA